MVESQLWPVVPNVTERSNELPGTNPGAGVEPVIWILLSPGLLGSLPWVAPPLAVKPVNCLSTTWQPPPLSALICVKVSVPTTGLPWPGQLTKLAQVKLLKQQT